MTATNPTPSSRALEELPESANGTWYGAWVLRHLTTLHRALRIAHAVDSGELRKDKSYGGSMFDIGHDKGVNAVLDELKAMGSE